MYKKYWVQNIRTNEELVVDAQNLNEVSQRLGWEKSLIRINKVYRRNGEPSNLILKY